MNLENIKLRVGRAPSDAATVPRNPPDFAGLQLRYLSGKLISYLFFILGNYSSVAQPHETLESRDENFSGSFHSAVANNGLRIRFTETVGTRSTCSRGFAQDNMACRSNMALKYLTLQLGILKQWGWRWPRRQQQEDGLRRPFVPGRFLQYDVTLTFFDPSLWSEALSPDTR